MKKTLTHLLFIFLLLFQLNSSAQTGQHVTELVNFDAAMLDLLSDHNVPGGQLAITYQGRLVYNRGFGYANTSTMTPVQPESIFRIASLSKPISSIAIMHLVENGLLSLSDTVFGANGILNDTTYSNILDSRINNIVVENLLDHSGGWNRDISGDPMFNSYAIATAMGVTPPADPVTVIRYMLANEMLDFTPATDYNYSNFGYCILGRVIEKVTGQAYEDFVRNTILLPLNISNMRLGYNLASNQLPDEVTYYMYPGAPLAYSVYDNTTQVPWPYGGFNVEAMDAHGGWVCSAANLVKLLTAVDGFSSKPDILLPATISTMVDPSANDPYYALGWSVNSFNNWWHTGSLSGTSTMFVRANNEMNWAILLNTRPSNSNALFTDMDALVWNVIPTIANWPTGDQFTGIEENYSTFSVKIHPSPTNGKITISSEKNIDRIEIYNLLGENIYTDNSPTLQNDLDVDITDQPSGIYFVKLKSNENYFTGKFLKL